MCISDLILTNIAIAPWYTSLVNLKIPSDLPITVPLLLNATSAASYDSVLVDYKNKKDLKCALSPLA